MGCDGWLEPEQLEELSGLKRIELPAGLTFATAQRLHRAGITPAPVNDLHFVVYPWVVDCAGAAGGGLAAQLRQRGRASACSLDQRAGHHAVAGRRLGRKDATITAAAGAGTVAVIGTAAIVRHARRRRAASRRGRRRWLTLQAVTWLSDCHPAGRVPRRARCRWTRCARPSPTRPPGRSPCSSARCATMTRAAA